MHPWLTRPLDRLAVQTPLAGLFHDRGSPVPRRLPPPPARGPSSPEAFFGAPPLAIDPATILSDEPGPRIRRLSWPSPRPSGLAANDQVRVTWRQAPESTGMRVVLVPAWRATHEWPLRSRVRRLLAAGIDVLFYHPPYHLSRKPAGMRPGTPFLCWDLPGVAAAYRQAVTELRQILSSPELLGDGPVGLIGLSLGAQLAALVTTLCETPAAVVLAAPPVDLAAIVRETPLGAIYRRLLRRSGQPLEPWWPDVERLSADLAPTRYPPAVGPSRILLAVGEHDLIVPPANSLSLADRWRIPRHRYRQGHISLVFRETGFVDELARMLRSSARAKR